MNLFLIGDTLVNQILEGIVGSLLNIVGSVLNIVWALLCNSIYGLISVLFDVLLTIPRINLLDNLAIEDIYQRITVIIVIVMTFYITFQVVKYVMQPDTISDKEKGAGNIALRLIVVILLIAFVPKIFSLAYDLQAKVINSNVIGKVILGPEIDNYKSLGGNFSANTFSIFYQVNDAVCNENSSTIDKSRCFVIEETVKMNLDLIRNNVSGHLLGTVLTTLTLQNGLLEQAVPTDSRYGTSLQPMIRFQGLLAVICGIYILWTLIVYGTEVARRYFQMIFLQITAPIAIISYVSPKKDGSFSKWLRQCITTYLDLFIRLFILYFILLIMNLLHESLFVGSFFDNISHISGTSGRGSALLDVLVPWVYIFLIIGLLQFLKKAPKMLKELLPSGNAASGEFGMSGKELIGSTKQIISGTSRAIGGVVGGFTGAKTAINSQNLKGKDKAWSALKGGFQGAKAGFSKGGGIRKANAAARASVYKDEDIAKAGGSPFGAQFRGNHYAKEAKGYERAESSLDDVVKQKKAVSSAVGETKIMKKMDSTVAEWKNRNISGGDEAKKALEKATRVYTITGDEEKYKRAIADTIRDVYQNEINNKGNVFELSAEQAKAKTARDEALSEISYYDSLEQEAKKDGRPALTEEQLKAREMAKVKCDEATKTIDETEAKLNEIDQLSNEQERVIRTFEEAREKDKNENNYTSIGVNLRKAQKAAQDAEYRYEKDGKIETVKLSTINSFDRDGKETFGDVTAAKINDLAKFAADIGDVESLASTAKDVQQASERSIKAKANADASGKSGN